MTQSRSSVRESVRGLGLATTSTTSSSTASASGIMITPSKSNIRERPLTQDIY